MYAKKIEFVFFRAIAIFYLVGALFHMLDLFDLRLMFSEMNTIWKAWTIYLLVFDSLTFSLLWKRKSLGQAILIIVAVSQLVAYIRFDNIFPNQYFLIVFHFVTLSLFAMLKIYMNLGSTRIQRS